jgi:O-antigen/teichoic acid export membrane protein
MVAPQPLRGIADTPSATASAGLPPPPSPGDPLTSGVVSGSLWRLGGHAAVVVASLAATPFVLRLLGAERYGVLVLIQVVIEYAAFATLGTAVGSTRFAAAAHSVGDEGEQVAVIWTAALIAGVAAIATAVAASLAAPWVVAELFRLPPELRPEAVTALRLAALGLVGRALSGCFNTPQIVHSRWDVMTAITSGSAVLRLLCVPVVLALGGGLVAAVAGGVVVTLAAAVADAVVSRRWQRGLLRPTLRASLVAPLLRFGVGLAISSTAAIALTNAERLFIARYEGTREVAYYSVAAALALVLSAIPMAVCQPLLPAFVRLLVRDEHARLQRLYERVVRGAVFVGVPATVALIAAAPVLFRLWAGPAFAERSLEPFYVLSVGLLVGSLAYVPKNILLADGRAGTIARWHLIELGPYLVGAAVLTASFGIVGAAFAWSARMVIDAAVFFRVAARAVDLPLLPLGSKRRAVGTVAVVAAAPVVVAALANGPDAVRLAACFVGIAASTALLWGRGLEEDERRWVRTTLTASRRRGLLGMDEVISG